MRRYWVDHALEVGIPYAISGDLFKHIHTVCRQDIGDEFELLPSLEALQKDQKRHLKNQSLESRETMPETTEAKEATAYLYKVKVKDIFKHTMVVDVLSRRVIPLIPRPHIHLALSIPKIKTFEDVIEKMVELGVYSVIPFQSDFSFFKSKDRMDSKSSRLRKIVISACQQSARAEEMTIHQVSTFDKVLGMYSERQKSGRVKAYAFYEGKAQSLSSYWEEESKKNEASPEDIWIFVGSEGGFSVDEIEKFKKAGIPSLSMGEQVLRVETACVSIVSVLKYKYCRDE